MDIIQNEKILHKNINHDIFLMQLNGLKIEKAIKMFNKKEVQIEYNSKQRNILKSTWIRYLKMTILSKFTKIVQFKVEKIESKNDDLTFTIFMICRKQNGTLDFTEVRVINKWENNYINKTQYKLINH